MPTFDVYVETLDRRSSFTVEWPGIRKITIKAAEEETVDG
jgi:hypothetical protein